MVALQAGLIDGEAGQAATDEPLHPGRIDVRERVLVKVAQEAAATVIGVDRGEVSVDVGQYGRGVAVRIATPLPIPDLDDTAAIEAGEPVLDRVATIQQRLRDRISHVLGREVVRVNITVTGAVIAEQRRVR
ncbi:hypothetical protein [Agromyces laixinhei]|uniref:hypothetical protein n=1 Tax=Agromyces laixinhei TaxID=2585717 RepID=UPI0012EE3B44|nr:hypothetical protein [Agromyces laixinhei]